MMGLEEVTGVDGLIRTETRLPSNVGEVGSGRHNSSFETFDCEARRKNRAMVSSSCAKTLPYLTTSSSDARSFFESVGF